MKLIITLVPIVFICGQVSAEPEPEPQWPFHPFANMIQFIDKFLLHRVQQLENRLNPKTTTAAATTAAAASTTVAATTAATTAAATTAAATTAAATTPAATTPAATTAASTKAA